MYIDKRGVGLGDQNLYGGGAVARLRWEAVS